MNVPLTGALVPAVTDYLAKNLARFGAARATLVNTSTTKLRTGLVVRFGQRYGGLPVLGSNLAAVVIKGHLVAVGGQVASIASLSDDVVLDRDGARARLLAALPTSTRASATVTRMHLALQVRGTTAHKVYVVRLSTAKPFDRRLVLVDAASGKVLASRSALVHAKGNAYPTNPVLNSTYKAFDLPRLSGDKSKLTGDYADVQSCGIKKTGKLECTRYAKPDSNGDFLSTPVEPSITDAFTETHAYYHVDLFHRWLKDTFGFARKRATQSIDVFVNYHREGESGAEGVYNAFFGDANNDGVGDIVFGQGRRRDFAYDGDVIYHEFVHSAIDETSNLSPSFDKLGFNHVPLALNEAFADLVSAIFTGDPKVGEYAGGQRGAIRDVSGNATCPDNLIGESHQDGLLWSRALWTVRATLTDKRLFDELVYNTMVGLQRTPGFGDATALFVKLAQASGDPSLATKVQAELSKRGVDKCTRVVPLTLGKRASGFMNGKGGGGLALWPASLQYSITVPKDATELTIVIEDRYAKYHGGQGNVGAYVRKAETVGFSTVKSKQDYIISNATPSLTLKKGAAKNGLEPGATYYVLPINVGQYQASYTVTVTAVQPPPPDAGAPLPDASAPTPDAGVPDTSAPAADAGPSSNQPGGCATAGSSRDSAASLLLALGLALLLVVSRRRRSR